MKEASSVVVKRDVVRRERGWRWGGMVVGGGVELVEEMVGTIEDALGRRRGLG